MTEKETHLVTVKLIPVAWSAVVHEASVSGDTMTDVINRACQFYTFYEEAKRQKMLPWWKKVWYLLTGLRKGK